MVSHLQMGHVGAITMMVVGIWGETTLMEKPQGINRGFS